MFDKLQKNAPKTSAQLPENITAMASTTLKSKDLIVLWADDVDPLTVQHLREKLRAQGLDVAVMVLGTDEDMAVASREEQLAAYTALGRWLGL